MKFQVGDNVVCIRGYWGSTIPDEHYYIIELCKNNYQVRVTNKLLFLDPEDFVHYDIYHSPLYKVLDEKH
jgi:hypothetical protein